ncbi:MAG: adenylate/guanylate cyclase domain-containing protein, partial [Actinomycetota bacterium]
VEELVGTVNMSQLRPGATLTAEEAWEATGLDREAFDGLLVAAGYSTDQRFTEDDVAAFRAFAAAEAIFSVEALGDFARVLTGAMARVADATSALFRIDAAPRIEEDGGAEVDYARQNYDSAQLTGELFTAMRALFRNQLMGAVRLSDQARQASTTDATSTISIAIGFVDIVGYTRYAASTAPDELARFIARFERQATDAVRSRGGRLVKLIGDEIMYVALSAADAVQIASAVIEDFVGTDALPRGGVAFGEVIGVGGDYYGPVVNKASRIVDQAVPGELLVDRAVVDAIGDSVTVTPAGRRQLKGFDEPVELFSVER